MESVGLLTRYSAIRAGALLLGSVLLVEVGLSRHKSPISSKSVGCFSCPGLLISTEAVLRTALLKTI